MLYSTPRLNSYPRCRLFSGLSQFPPPCFSLRGTVGEEPLVGSHIFGSWCNGVVVDLLSEDVESRGPDRVGPTGLR